VNPLTRGPRGRFIYAFWHEYLLIPARFYVLPDLHVLISEHADGEMIAEACRRIGFGLVRGSTTRGGARALLQIARSVQSGKAHHLAVTPDGPRGPRRTVHPGLVYMAGLTGLPIVPVGFAYRGAWRMNSWDRFAVPYPFTTATCVMGGPIAVPGRLGKEKLESYRRRVEDAMLAMGEAAERMAGTAPRREDVAPDRKAA
jgi:lysophospholipid acyltransferase (LPLAT)-like uncharacterized protein